MCGVWYLTTLKRYSLKTLIDSATCVEHRGQDGYGSYIGFGNGSSSYFTIERKDKALSFPDPKKRGNTWCVNFKYTTIGQIKSKYENKKKKPKVDLKELPPIMYIGKENVVKKNVSGNNALLVFLNGEFKTDEQKIELAGNPNNPDGNGLGFVIRASSDTAVVGAYVQNFLLNGHNLFDATIETLKRISGTYLIVLIRNGKTVIARDPWGTRNASIYISDDLGTIIVSSEPQSFYDIDPDYIKKPMKDHPYSAGYRPLFPGEVIEIYNQEITRADRIRLEDLLWLKENLNLSAVA